MRTSCAAARLRLAVCSGVWLVSAFGLAGGSARAATPPLAIAVVDPGELTVGEAASVEVAVRVGAAGRGQPLLLTPFTEGRAIGVVRGRLLRSDASDPEAEVLRFRVPVLAHSAGTAILRIQVVTYRCALTCELARGTASAVLRAAPPT